MTKRMPQTEEKAKGLIGLEKGKKVKGAAYSVGNYKGKTLNLSKKQIAASGKRAVSASRQKATNISDTNFVQGKGVMKGGKLFTGTVDLGGGNMATYVGGKRVRARSGGGGGGGGGGGKKPSNYMTASRLGKPGEYQAGRGMTNKRTGKLAERPGEYQAGRGQVARSVTGGVKRPIPYTSYGPYNSSASSRENKLLNQINIEKQRMRQSRERGATKAATVAQEARIRELQRQLDALRKQK